ncbi:MAG: tetratricopeptide repeat protein [Tannerellaceae bacterium]|jgi:tetratricopeptide (TPR) repeat protein|nr:tetratricopeptide repeat protein [Tannerellaceae bacterium]
MKQDDISTLLQRYLTACKKGTEPYFDADEIDAILDSFEEKEDFTHYEALLALGLRLHPDNPDLKIRQCKFHVYNEDYRQALDLLDSIAEANSEETGMIRLECYCALGQYPKAIEYMEELMEANCDYVENLFEFLTPVLSDLEMMTEARDFVERGLSLFPDNLVLKDELCYILELEGDFEQAIRLCNELIDKEPYSYEYWFSLGRLYSQTNDFDNAIEAFDFALTCDDSDDELKVLKAYCLFMNENYEKAIEVYSEIATDEVSVDSVKSLMAECYIKLDDFEHAYHLFKEIISRQTDAVDASVYISFIRCCVETDRENEASQTLVKAADIFPDNVRILSLLALNYLEHGKEDLALRITGKILEHLGSIRVENEEEDYEKLFEEKQPIFTRDNLEKVVKYYKKILQLSPNLSFKNKHIPPEDLTKVYLNDRNNCN